MIEAKKWYNKTIPRRRFMEGHLYNSNGYREPYGRAVRRSRRASINSEVNSRGSHTSTIKIQFHNSLDYENFAYGNNNLFLFFAEDRIS